MNKRMSLRMEELGLFTDGFDNGKGVKIFGKNGKACQICKKGLKCKKHAISKKKKLKEKPAKKKTIKKVEKVDSAGVLMEVDGPCEQKAGSN